MRRWDGYRESLLEGFGDCGAKAQDERRTVAILQSMSGERKEEEGDEERRDTQQPESRSISLIERITALSAISAS